MLCNNDLHFTGWWVTAQGPLGWFCIWDVAEVSGVFGFGLLFICHLDSFRKRQSLTLRPVSDHTPIPDPTRLNSHRHHQSDDNTCDNIGSLSANAIPG